MPRRKRELELDPETGEPIVQPEPEERRPQQVERVRNVSHKAIESAVGLLNGVVAMVSPADALTIGERKPSQLVINLEDEFGMLVDALDDTQKQHVRFRKLLGRFCFAAGGANLLGVVGLILYKRYMMRLQPVQQEAVQPEGDGAPVVHVRPNGLLPVEPEQPDWSTVGQ